MSKKVAQVIVETLQSAGVKNCYGIVGDTLNTFATCLSRSDIKFVHMRHEEAGAFAAQGEALLPLCMGRRGDVFEMIGENL
ncbi:MAG TPA: thiamine pyrophosphate-binding protein [Steroidobacteraceae bacterium]|jgi:pyruvate dehydrogenase (quinone)